MKKALNVAVKCVIQEPFKKCSILFQCLYLCTFFGKYYITASSTINTGTVQSWYAATDRHILWQYRL